MVTTWGIQVPEYKYKVLNWFSSCPESVTMYQTVNLRGLWFLPGSGWSLMKPVPPPDYRTFQRSLCAKGGFEGAAGYLG